GVKHTQEPDLRNDLLAGLLVDDALGVDDVCELARLGGTAAEADDVDIPIPSVVSVDESAVRIFDPETGAITRSLLESPADDIRANADADLVDGVATIDR